MNSKDFEGYLEKRGLQRKFSPEARSVFGNSPNSSIYNILIGLTALLNTAHISRDSEAFVKLSEMKDLAMNALPGVLLVELDRIDDVLPF